MPLLYRGRPFLTVSDASARDLAAIGVDPAAITVVRNGLAVAPPAQPPLKAPAPRLAVLSRLVPHKQIEDALEARKAEIDILELVGVDLPITRERVRQRDIVEEITRRQAVREIR